MKRFALALVYLLSLAYVAAFGQSLIGGFQISSQPGSPLAFDRNNNLYWQGQMLAGPNFPQSLSPKAFGAKCDGVTDDTTALQNWLNALSSQAAGALPAGTCNFSSTLTAPSLSNLAIVGVGPYNSILQYVGASTTVDLLDFGSGSGVSGQLFGLYLARFRFTSTTHMTGGAGLHIKAYGFPTLQNITADGQVGANNLFNGVWFDQVGNAIYDGYDTVGSNDAIRINGSVGSGLKADLYLTHGKSSGSAVGLHIGGAYGGFTCDTSDIIVNGINILVDTALAAEGNRELFFSDTCIADSSTTGDNVKINDTLTSGATLVYNGWVGHSASGFAGLDIVSWPSSNVSINANEIFNTSGDGLKIQDATAIITVGTGTNIRGNLGLGINATTPLTNLYVAPQNVYGNTGGNANVNAGVFGAWTPQLQFGGATTGITTSGVAGQYYTYGPIIFAQFGILLSSKGTATGNATICGLPFSTSNAGDGPGAGGVTTFLNNFAALTSSVTVTAASGTSCVNLLQTGATSTANVTNGNFTNTSQIYGNIIYHR